MRNYSLIQDIEILEKLKVNQSQLLLLKMMFEAEENRVPIYKTIGKLVKLKLLDLDCVADLVSRGIVEDYNKMELQGSPEFAFDYLELTPKALKLLNVPSFKARELMKLYPRLLESNGTRYNLVNIGEVDLAITYENGLNVTETEHKEVVELLKWGKENGVVNVGLKKFADTHYWLTIKEIKENGSGSNFKSISVEMV